MGAKNRTVEQELARIAGSQHGVVTRAQLLSAGISRREIAQRVEIGSLLREHRAVYRVGHRAQSLDSRYMSAVLACGDGALLCGRAAGHLLGLLKGAPPAPEVLTPTERRVKGVTTHRARANGGNNGRRVRGIPVTTVPRTLVDLASALSVDALARACHEAGVLHRITPRQVEAILSLRPNAAGAARLRAVMAGDVRVTLSHLERAFLKLLREASLPLPVTNRVASGRRVDCRWPEYRLTVELDSYRFHNSRYSWEQDRRRRREARARGDEFERYSYGDVLEDPKYMLAELRGLLSAHRPA
ncbi:MAG: hypothetical protein QOE08_486 [Thermoleophilaceae bacterium]|nr:hypothetical protein [Thermoleophilaceae bacterium]